MNDGISRSGGFPIADSKIAAFTSLRVARYSFSNTIAVFNGIRQYIYAFRETLSYSLNPSGISAVPSLIRLGKSAFKPVRSRAEFRNVSSEIITTAPGRGKLFVLRCSLPFSIGNSNVSQASMESARFVIKSPLDCVG